jgi:tetratricopeptide (TPR) repeat protein
VLRKILERLQKRADTLSARVPHGPDALAHLESCIEAQDVTAARAALDELAGTTAGTRVDVLKARLALLEQRYTDSEQLLADVLLYEPRNAEALAWQAATQMHLQRPDAALETGSQALRLGYRGAWLHELQGFIHFFAGHSTEAIRAWKSSLDLEPERTSTHRNLVEVYAKLGLWTEQAPHLEIASASDGDTDMYLTYHAFALLEQGERDKAFALLERALAADADAGTARNAAAAYFNEGELDACEAAMCKSPDSGPDAALFAVTRANIALIKHGPSEDAWRLYEERQRLPDWTVLADGPRWDGLPLRPGQRLVVSCEQGLGDTLMFARLIPGLVEQAAGPVLFVVQPPLLRLMQQTQAQLPGWERVTIAAPPAAVVDTDVFMPLMSAFHVAKLPFAGPDGGYLRSSADLQQKWAELLGPSNGKKRIGLVWAGNPNRADDRVRSIPTAELAALGSAQVLERVTFVNLQMNAREEYFATPLPLPHLDLRGHIKDFADSAALCRQLDRVISIDTAAAHLAGAVGTPCSVLLCTKLDWRWEMEGMDQRWYYSHQSHKKATNRSWRDTLEPLRREL